MARHLLQAKSHFTYKRLNFAFLKIEMSSAIRLRDTLICSKDTLTPANRYVLSTINSNSPYQWQACNASLDACLQLINIVQLIPGVSQANMILAVLDGYDA